MATALRPSCAGLLWACARGTEAKRRKIRRTETPTPIVFQDVFWDVFLPFGRVSAPSHYQAGCPHCDIRMVGFLNTARSWVDATSSNPNVAFNHDSFFPTRSSSFMWMRVLHVDPELCFLAMLTPKKKKTTVGHSGEAYVLLWPSISMALTPFGGGSKLNHPGTADFRLLVHLKGLPIFDPQPFEAPRVQ